MFQSDPLFYLHNITITGINWIGMGSIRRCWTEDMISMSIYFLSVTQSHLKIFGLSFISPLTTENMTKLARLTATMSLCIWYKCDALPVEEPSPSLSDGNKGILGMVDLHRKTIHTLYSNAVSCTWKLRQSKPTKFILGILGLLRATLYNVPSSSSATKVPPSTCFIVPNTKLEL